VKEERMRSLKVFSVLLIANFFGCTVALGLGVLLGGPFVRWVVHGVLYFPVSGPELLRLAWYVLGMTAVMTILMWLEGKWKGRW